jgi:hypothetical protein
VIDETKLSDKEYQAKKMDIICLAVAFDTRDFMMESFRRRLDYGVHKVPALEWTAA